MILASAIGDFAFGTIIFLAVCFGLLGEVIERASPNVKKAGGRAAMRGGMALFNHLTKK